jgi:hypothetical protein
MHRPRGSAAPERSRDGTLRRAQALEALGLRMDDRDRMRAKDLISQATFGEQPARQDEICLRKFVIDNGCRQFGVDARVGKVAKKLYLQDHPGFTFPKKKVNVNGQLLDCNIWYESQRPYLEQALAQVTGGSASSGD